MTTNPRFFANHESTPLTLTGFCMIAGCLAYVGPPTFRL